MARLSSKSLFVLLAAGFGAFGTACAMVWGFEDPLDPTQSPALVGDGSISEGRAPDCESQKVDEAAGVFVIGGGPLDAGTSEDPLCGAKDVPCTHIATGLSRARDLGKSIVYVVRGTYIESVTVPGGVTLQGGWNALKTGASIAYAKACSDPPGTTVIIQAPEDQNAALLVDDADKPVVLNDLGIRSKTTAATSESLYAIRIHGKNATPNVTLIDVVALSAGGGAGVAGGDGQSGDAGAGACDPTNPSIVGDAGSAPTGDAGRDGDGGAGARFDENGIAAIDGIDGVPGATGYSGVTPANPTEIECVSCALAGLPVPMCTASDAGVLTGIAGQAGCGGHGGTGGRGGGGGGSSVALYAWNANVTVTRGSFTAGNGGAGAAGGSGAIGGAGALGTNGTDSTACATDCSGLACTKGPTSTAKGSTGTRGGIGGGGGAGGGGAGGDSFAIAFGGAAMVNVNPMTTFLAPGTAGSAPIGAAPGKSAPQGGPN